MVVDGDKEKIKTGSADPCLRRDDGNIESSKAFAGMTE
jgi:hypothetical protein